MHRFYIKYILFASPAILLTLIVPAYEANMIPLSLFAIVVGILIANEIHKNNWSKGYVLFFEIIIFVSLIILLFLFEIPRLILVFLLCMVYIHIGIFARLKYIDKIANTFGIILLIISAIFSPLFYFMIEDIFSTLI